MWECVFPWLSKKQKRHEAELFPCNITREPYPPAVKDNSFQSLWMHLVDYAIRLLSNVFGYIIIIKKRIFFLQKEWPQVIWTVFCVYTVFCCAGNKWDWKDVNVTFIPISTSSFILQQFFLKKLQMWATHHSMTKEKNGLKNKVDMQLLCSICL